MHVLFVIHMMSCDPSYLICMKQKVVRNDVCKSSFISYNKREISKHMMQNSNLKYTVAFQISNLLTLFCSF